MVSQVNNTHVQSEYFIVKFYLGRRNDSGAKIVACELNI